MTQIPISGGKIHHLCRLLLFWHLEWSCLLAKCGYLQSSYFQSPGSSWAYLSLNSHSLYLKPLGIPFQMSWDCLCLFWTHISLAPQPWIGGILKDTFFLGSRVEFSTEETGNSPGKIHDLASPAIVASYSFSVSPRILSLPQLWLLFYLSFGISSSCIFTQYLLPPFSCPASLLPPP